MPPSASLAWRRHKDSGFSTKKGAYNYTLLFFVEKPLSSWNSPQNYGPPLVNGITQCYLPPDRGDRPAFTPTGQVGTRFIDPVRMKGWVGLVLRFWTNISLILGTDRPTRYDQSYSTQRGRETKHLHNIINLLIWRCCYDYAMLSLMAISTSHNYYSYIKLK